MSSRLAVVLASVSTLAVACQGDVQVVEVKTPPTAEINSPGENAQEFAAGALITFEGVVQDQQDSPERLTVTWSSDRDGMMSEDTPDSNGRVAFSTVDLSEGIHVVTLQVIDTDGEIGEDNVSLQVERINNAPEVVIEYPTTGQEFVEGDVITFTAVASDPDDADPPESLEVIWDDDVDGVIGNDAPDSSGAMVLNVSNLSLGAHLVSVEVSDSMGATASDQVYLEVVEANEPPEVMITSPNSGDTVLFSDVSFTAEVSDDLDRADTLAITWESDISGVFNWDNASADGYLGFDTTSLATGLHTITLTARDSGDLSAEDNIQLLVVGAGDWDADGDGWTPNEGDCDDDDGAISPGATEACDDIDNDCDGEINEGMGDGYEPNELIPTDLGHMEADSFCAYSIGYLSGSADIQIVSGTIHNPDDVDSFVFTTTDDVFDCLDEPGYGIQISLTGIPAGHNYALDLYWNGGGGALVSSSDTSYNANEYVNFEGSYSVTGDGDDGGEFEIVVSPSAGSGYGCSGSYTLEVEVW